MFKIGEFSKLGRVSVKTLRYYDQVGLLKPARVDRFTGYRYYSMEQLPRLHRILALKDLGFSLEQIARLLDEGLPPAELRGMLRLRQAESRRRMEEEQARLARVETRLRLVEKEGTMPEDEVVLKKVEAQRVAMVRDVIPTFAEVGRLFGEVEAHLAQHGVKPAGACMAIYYDDEYKERDIDAAATVPVEGPVPETDRVKVRELPAVETMACLLHKGPYKGLAETYDALIRWIQANGYRIVGPNREVYLRGQTDSSLEYAEGHLASDPSEYLTEVQFPVR